MNNDDIYIEKYHWNRIDISHNLYNPNNIIIDKENYYTIPFGHRCTSALALRVAGLRKFSLPFDWVKPIYPNKIRNILENNFEGFIPDINSMDNNVPSNKYNINFHHFNKNIDEGVKEYSRRIERFNKIMNENKKLYFVYVNEDYIYDEKHRDNKFNEDIFSQMVELESYLKKKYSNLNYAILYFNFIEHEIPKDSNIINIVLHTSNISNVADWKNFQPLRKYVGNVLCNIFEKKGEWFEFTDEMYNE